LEKQTVVVAGARGFVGQALIETLVDEYSIIALSRHGHSQDEAVEWRPCDLFSRKDTFDALKGADLAVYLVHSMLPSARLTQGNFEDMDLICADNFARAAAANGIRQIVYLGGIMPASQSSRHLESRYEVEKTLGAYGVPVTSLRAGLVVGPNGSSTAMVIRLVEKLPAMICPAWTRTETQPIALKDVVRLLKFVLGNEACFDDAYDVGGPDVMPYKTMLELTAEIMGVKRLMLDGPDIPAFVSTTWVSRVTGAPAELVAPLVESLAHRMVAADDRLVEMSGFEMTPFETSMREAVEAEVAASTVPVAFDRKRSRRSDERSVRSVQRVPLPENATACWVALEYARWLPDFLAPLLRVEVDETRTRFFVKGVIRPLLELTLAEVSESDRQLFWITGGLLAKPNLKGRLEFREVLGGTAVLAAIHDFQPTLPWYIYRYTQALVHLYVMSGFREYLEHVQPLES